MKITEYLQQIEEKLHRHFDLEKDYIFDGINFNLFAKFNQRNERYILTKKATIYAMETNEFCFIKHYESIDEGDLKFYPNTLIRSIDTMVNGDEDHMSSVITGVMVVDKEPTDEIINMVKKFKYHKGFAFGFKGWVDVRLLLINLNNGSIVTNKKGKEVRSVYKIE